MTDKLREAAQMALETLVTCRITNEFEPGSGVLKEIDDSITALRAALANEFNPDWDAMAVMVEEQQRMAKRIEELESALAQPIKPDYSKAGFGQPEQEPPCKTGSQCVGNKCERCAVQPEREWQGLTDEERQECLYFDPIFGMAASTFARAIEAKLKEKNA